ncbi:hypothetical protein [Hydrogenophaga sp. ANAO-22]|uniref:hypothetical protein n=1 Tax=Hydrogenophaga sp. ANAO-22 TaxID=3166645 RepID=UPI0036D26586
MIASNFLKHPDAQLRQMEMDLAGVPDATDEQRAAWWTWLMNATKHEAPVKPAAPAWWKAAKRAAAQLAQAVRRAIVALF